MGVDRGNTAVVLDSLSPNDKLAGQKRLWREWESAKNLGLWPGDLNNMFRRVWQYSTHHLARGRVESEQLMQPMEFTVCDDPS